MAAGTAARAARLPRRRPRRPRAAVLRRRRIALLLAAAALLSGFYLLWFRDSSLVAVRQVQVNGVTTSNGEAIRGALDRAARETTTLNVDLDRLRAAVRDYPSVDSLSADPSFPSGLTIDVTERQPAALLGSGASAVPVAGDGTVLRGIDQSGVTLPRMRGTPPSSGRLTGVALEEASVLGAVPDPLRAQVASAANGPEGVKVELEPGIELVFGNASRATAKWAAAARVLADPKLTSVAYVDVRSPERPAAGGAVTSPE
jgi:cell division protein FtsQ